MSEQKFDLIIPDGYIDFDMTWENDEYRELKGQLVNKMVTELECPNGFDGLIYDAIIQGCYDELIEICEFVKDYRERKENKGE